jgi:hypothetical protein
LRTALSGTSPSITAAARIVPNVVWICFTVRQDIPMPTV